MAKTLLIIFIISFFAMTTLSSVKAGLDFGSELSWLTAARPGCDGPMGECGELDEFELDSEINRRILATSRYISYASLNKNSVPCSRRGSSYYNCRPGSASNPYSRGCSAITRCRS